jgi:hypothetical protein
LPQAFPKFSQGASALFLAALPYVVVSQGALIRRQLQFPVKLLRQEMAQAAARTVAQLDLFLEPVQLCPQGIIDNYSRHGNDLFW